VTRKKGTQIWYRFKNSNLKTLIETLLPTFAKEKKTILKKKKRE